MARIYFVSFVTTLLLLTSCGQVGTITGGEKDTVAPRIIVENVQPPMGSTNIFPQEVIIPFDEFIELNKPAENIQVTPADVKLDYSIKKKAVVLKVEEGSWAPNTTYTIYLNHAVKDITEANDSIIAYVFSTGDYLDSLQTAVQVNDAFTNKPVEGVTVGLYTSQLNNDTSKIEPRYYASTNKKGIAVFRNIKKATFYSYAFEDENRNNYLDATEKRAVLRAPVELDTAVTTGPIIRLMPPESKTLQVVSNEVHPTANWCMSFNRTLNNNEKFEFLSPQPSYVLWNKQRDSLTAFFETTKNAGSFSGVLHSARLKDTISKKYFFKEKGKLEIKTNLVNKQLEPNDTLKLISNEPFQTVDTTVVQLMAIKKGDSVKHSLTYVLDSVSPLERNLYFEKENQEKLFLTIPPAGLRGQNYGLEDSLNLDFTLQKAKETGTMIIEFDTIPAYGIVYITNKKSNEKIKVEFDGVEKRTHQIDFLQPGQYGFHYLYDEDKNGKWSTGSIFKNSEAEKIVWFSTVSTIRANWEVKTTLMLKETKKNEEKIITK